MSLALELYVKQGCHLCEDLLQQLQEIAEQRPFILNTIDITSDKGLLALYGEKVPVLTHGVNEVCHYFLDLVALNKVLDDELPTK